MPRWIPLTIGAFWKSYTVVPHDPVLGACWEWAGVIRTQGKDKRGLVYFQGKRWQAHRLSYELRYGIPTGMSILHHCDNGACIRPDHLWHGTKRDNTLDMWRKGRASGMCLQNHLGSNSPRSKFTDEQVVAIRAASKTGQKQRDIAKEYNSSQGAIWYIIH